MRERERERMMKLLEWEDGCVGDGGVSVVSPCASPVKSARQFEPAGVSFHKRALQQRGLYKRLQESEGNGIVIDYCSSSDVDDEDDCADGDDTDEESRSNGNGIHASDAPLPTLKGTGMRGDKGSKRKGGKKKRLDYYALLGLEHERYLASEKDIQRAYKDTALKYHPDKRGAAIAEEKEKELIEERFKAIQEAYETLSDPEKRRLYDSMDEFDDTLPTSCEPGEFYNVFGAAFKRQSKWSVKKNVPLLGDDDSNMDDVDNFYDFWFTLKSWREFPSEEEFDLETAEDRMHKRWMERQNSKMRERAKKDAEKRLRLFVEQAYAIDPRIVRRKKFEREQKEAKKRAVAEAKQKELDEKLQREENEKKVQIEGN